jgi:hypothetical protein
MRVDFKKAHNKSLPILKYRIAHPDATFDEIAERFKRTRASIYSLFKKHNLVHLPEPTRRIIEDPFDIGHEIPVIAKQEAINFEDFRIKHPEEVYSKPDPTYGQKVLRKEMDRLYAEIANLDILDDVNDSIISQHAAEIEQLKSDIVGYRAVISYLQGRLDGATV